MPNALIQCVVVLYGKTADESQALNSLVSICRGSPEIGQYLDLYIQDNSPASENGCFNALADLVRAFEYRHAPENPGLAAAYNEALGRARENQIEWLLLLDHDTALDDRYFQNLLDAIHSEAAGRACAFVPQLIKRQIVLSPQIAGRVFYHRLPLGFVGFTSAPLVAFNSGACLKVASVVDIGGFPSEYWLDYLDHIVFHRLQAAGGRVYVLNSQLHHELSLVNIEAEVSVARYTNLLAAEWMYVKESNPRFGPLIHRARLSKRAASHFFRLKNKAYAFKTLSAAFKR